MAHGGDGEAWSARALLVGPAAEAFHGRYIQHVVDAAFWRWEDEERARHVRQDRPSRERAQAFAREQRDRRRDRLQQAVNTFAKLPIEIEPPPVGAVREVFAIQDALGCSRSTAFRLARAAGVEPRLHHRGWYCDTATVEFTPELITAMRAWAAAPRTRYSLRRPTDLGAGKNQRPGPLNEGFRGSWYNRISLRGDGSTSIYVVVRSTLAPLNVANTGAGWRP